MRWRAAARDQDGLIAEICTLRQAMEYESLESPPNVEFLNDRFQEVGQSLMADRIYEAIPELFKLVAWAPRWATVWFFIGYAYRVGQNKAASVSEYSGLSIIKTSDVYIDDVRRRELTRAVDALEVARTVDPGLAEANNELAACLLLLQLPHEALEPAIRYVRLSPSTASAYSNLSRIFLELGDIINSVDFARRALQLDPVDRVAKNLLTIISEADL